MKHAPPLRHSVLCLLKSGVWQSLGEPDLWSLPPPLDKAYGGKNPFQQLLNLHAFARLESCPLTRGSFHYLRQ